MFKRTMDRLIDLYLILIALASMIYSLDLILSYQGIKWFMGQRQLTNLGMTLYALLVFSIVLVSFLMLS